MTVGNRLRATVEAERQRLAQGERPVYHVACTPAAGGSVDVTVVELPIVHLFVPGMVDVLDGARVLIARTLGVDPHEFDVTLAAATTGDGG